MINSITFDMSAKNNYILDKKYKEVFKKGKTKKAYEKALQEYEKNKTNWRHPQKYYSKSEIYNDFIIEKEDGYKNPELVKNLKGRTITFSKDKINIIFGPNASGKTTILKAIAANTLCGSGLNLDGMINPMMCEPMDLNPEFFISNNLKPFDKINDVYTLVSQEDYDKLMNNLKKVIDKKAGNGISLNWDGSLVYYENYANRINTGSCNDFVGTIMGSFGEAAYYHMQSKNISLGQQTVYLFNRITNLLHEIKNNNLTTQTIIDNSLNKSCKNEYWYAAKQIQIDYIKQYYKGNQINETPTFLIDELDKSLDIINIISLYRDILPDIIHKNNVQFIMISHSPIVLSSLLNNEDYNIISIDEDYTDNVRKQLSGCSF